MKVSKKQEVVTYTIMATANEVKFLNHVLGGMGAKEDKDARVPLGTGFDIFSALVAAEDK